MELEPSQQESQSSLASLVDTSLGLISPNTEILACMICGVIGTMVEVAGYWPTLHFQDYVPDQSEDDEDSPLQPELKRVIYAKVSDGVDFAQFYSVHIYLAAYILLPYPLIMEKQKVLLVPWLLCSVLRSILLTLLQSLAGIVLCAAKDKVYYKCLQYSTMSGVKLCFSLFMWTSVHSFYHYLDKRKSNHEFEMVIKTIHKAGMRKNKSDSIGSSGSSRVLQFEALDEDEMPGTEATLVERAAMAWIAREILEDDGEYVTDSQFSHYLAHKATMELRQITRELSEKRRELRTGETSTEDRIKDSLEFCKKTSKHYESIAENWQPRKEAFDESTELSKRDPLRKLLPLVVRGRTLIDDDESFAGDDLEPLRLMSDDSATSAVLENSVEVQTDPLSFQMKQLFDLLDQQHAKQKSTNHNIQNDPRDNRSN